MLSQFVWLLSLWPLLAVGSKRLHDRNNNGRWLLVLKLLPFALFAAGLSVALFDDPRTGRSGDLATCLDPDALLAFPPALWGIVELGILLGTRRGTRDRADPGAATGLRTAGGGPGSVASTVDQLADIPGQQFQKPNER